MQFLEEQGNKLVKVLNNGNELQQHLQKRQFQIKDMFEKQNEKVERLNIEHNCLEGRLKEGLAQLENKLDRILDMIAHDSEHGKAEVNHSFDGGENSPKIVAESSADTIEQLSSKFSDVEIDGKLI